ncbi:hypothetical protein Tco_1569981 [Tanacetum coccineum]
MNENRTTVDPHLLVSEQVCLSGGDIYDDPSILRFYQNDDTPPRGNNKCKEKGEDGLEWTIRSRFEDELANFMLEKKSCTKGIGEILDQAPSGVNTQDPSFPAPSQSTSTRMSPQPLSLSFDFVFAFEIFKSLSFSLDRLCHLAILCLDQHALTLHHLECLLTISLDRLDIFKEDLVYHRLRKSLSLIL